ncbi:MAG TPA: response regulator transcription factor [Methylomirabilota bacterium]|nr:response regulator transcription factor [Methylomirabilota bacterium]
MKKPEKSSSTGTSTRIVLADDQNVVREGLKCLLELEDDLEVVGETADGLEVVSLVERLRPNVLIVDVAMPGLYGLEVTRQVRERSPRTGVIVLSRYVNEWYVTEALRNGASGYVVKQAPAHELTRAVRTVAQGRRYLSSPLSPEDVQTWLLQAERLSGDSYESLTSREREVLQLVAEGFSSTRIARRLSISVRTAEAHRANVMRKLRLKNYTALIKYALARGVLPPIEPLPPGFRAVKRRRPTGR